MITVRNVGLKQLIKVSDPRYQLHGHKHLSLHVSWQRDRWTLVVFFEYEPFLLAWHILGVAFYLITYWLLWAQVISILCLSICQSDILCVYCVWILHVAHHQSFSSCRLLLALSVTMDEQHTWWEIVECCWSQWPLNDSKWGLKNSSFVQNLHPYRVEIVELKFTERIRGFFV